MLIKGLYVTKSQWVFFNSYLLSSKLNTSVLKWFLPLAFEIWDPLIFIQSLWLLIVQSPLGPFHCPDVEMSLKTFISSMASFTTYKLITPRIMPLDLIYSPNSRSIISLGISTPHFKLIVFKIELPSFPPILILFHCSLIHEGYCHPASFINQKSGWVLSFNLHNQPSLLSLGDSQEAQW